MGKIQASSVHPGPGLSRLVTMRRTAPHIDISVFGWPADGAQVRVSLASHRGRIAIGSYDDDDAGNTKASLSASSLAHITSLRVVDRRPVATNEARRAFLAHADAVWLPTDGPTESQVRQASHEPNRRAAADHGAPSQSTAHRTAPGAAWRRS